MDYKKALEDARRDFETNMNWVEYSNKYFGPGNPYVPKNRSERKDFIASLEYKEIQDMKFMLQDRQGDMLGSGETLSGEFRIRVPASLHRFLKEEAVKEGVSLNALCIAKLSVPLYDHLRGTWK